MRWVVYGAGAVGGVIGGHLHLAGLPATLVARGAHLAAIRDGGLRLDTGDGMHRIVAPATDTAAEVEWTADTAVLLAVKSHQAAAALADLAAHAPPGTTVVCATNGVATEVAALRRFAATYAVCVMLPATHLEPGVVVAKCHPVPGILDVGRIPAGTDDRTAAVASDLRVGRLRVRRARRHAGLEASQAAAQRRQRRGRLVRPPGRPRTSWPTSPSARASTCSPSPGSPWPARRTTGSVAATCCGVGTTCPRGRLDLAEPAPRHR